VRSAWQQLDTPPLPAAEKQAGDPSEPINSLDSPMAGEMPDRISFSQSA
jgi:hypothetical protein